MRDFRLRKRGDPERHADESELRARVLARLHAVRRAAGLPRIQPDPSMYLEALVELLSRALERAKLALAYRPSQCDKIKHAGALDEPTRELLLHATDVGLAVVRIGDETMTVISLGHRDRRPR